MALSNHTENYWGEQARDPHTPAVILYCRVLLRVRPVAAGGLPLSYLAAVSKGEQDQGDWIATAGVALLPLTQCHLESQHHRDSPSATYLSMDK